jgi:hypothetical protein
MFCGFSKKWTVGQIRIHLTKENEGATHCHACPQVPPEITQFYRELRDAFVSEQKQKSSKAVERLREEMSLTPLDDDSTGPSPQSSQPDSAGSTPKRPRHGPSPGPSQPTIRQSFVSQFCFCYKKESQRCVLIYFGFRMLADQVIST